MGRATKNRKRWIKTGVLKKENRRTVPFSLFYFKYFVFLFIGILVMAGLILLAFSFLIVNGYIYPAYYAQEQAREAKEAIADAAQVDEALIPELCSYVVFDDRGAVQAGNLKGRSIPDAWRAVKERTQKSGGSYYTVIAREGEYCVLQYKIVPQYRSPVLRRYLLNPQNLLLLCGLAGVLLVVILTAVLFGRTMKKKLEPLITVTEKIQKQELDVTVASSDIREIDAVLRAMEDMRGALKASLESQWRQEQEKKEQILALAHDLKTPLTLVLGNADLLRETADGGEQRECVDLIEKNARSMQRYVQVLMEISRDGYQLRMQNVALAPFLEEALMQLRELCSAKKPQKKIRIKTDFAYHAQQIFIDRELFLRALTNVFSNAAEYAAADGTVLFAVRQEGESLSFTVTDNGSGFSGEALKHAAEQFFTGDKSRGRDGHFGIGLYMVKLVAEQHGGQLLFENSKETGGARVCMKIFV